MGVVGAKNDKTCFLLKEIHVLPILNSGFETSYAYRMHCSMIVFFFELLNKEKNPLIKNRELVSLIFQNF